MVWCWALVIVGALLVLVEVAFGGFAGFDLVLIGSSFAAGGALGLALGNARLAIIVASLLCLAYIAVGRRWVRRRLHVRQPHPSNIDALIGQRGLVTVALADHAPGQVRVRDEVWRSRPAAGLAGPVEAGTEVIVESVEGVTLIVRRV